MCVKCILQRDKESTKYSNFCNERTDTRSRTHTAAASASSTLLELCCVWSRIWTSVLSSLLHTIAWYCLWLARTHAKRAIDNIVCRANNEQQTNRPPSPVQAIRQLAEMASGEWERTNASRMQRPVRKWVWTTIERKEIDTEIEKETERASESETESGWSDVRLCDGEPYTYSWTRYSEDSQSDNLTRYHIFTCAHTYT